MGAYVSRDECEPRYGIKLNCTIVKNSTTDQITRIGLYGQGEVQPDGDIAGRGVVSVFIAVTSFALALSIIAVSFTIAKWLGWKSSMSDEEKRLRLGRGSRPVSVTTLCEAVIVSCSDQQVFTGGAYAVTLRYFKGCVITAYHYNIVANMMLLACATHMLSVTVVRDYWRYPWLAAVRSAVTFLMFLVTGLLLANQNASGVLPFPSGLPQDPSALMFLPAACYQDDHAQLVNTLGQSFGKGAENFGNVIMNSRPGNRIQGWNLYLVTVLFYGAALLLELARWLVRSRDRGRGLGYSIVQGIRRCSTARLGTAVGFFRRLGRTILFLYLCGGIVISSATVVLSSTYMMDLRRWARYSGWLETDPETRKSSEDDAYAFGQMVPVLLCLLTVFAVVEKCSQMNSGERANRHYTLAGTVTPSISTYFGAQSRKHGGGSGSGAKACDQSNQDVTTIYESQLLLTPDSACSSNATLGETPTTPGFLGVVGGVGAAPATLTALPPPASQQPSPSGSQVRFVDAAGSAATLLAGYNSHPLTAVGSADSLRGSAKSGPSRSSSSVTGGALAPPAAAQSGVAASAAGPVGIMPYEHVWRQVSAPASVVSGGAGKTGSEVSFSLPLPVYLQGQQQQTGVSATPPSRAPAPVPVVSAATDLAPCASRGFASVAVGIPDQTGHRNADGYFPLQPSGSPPQGWSMHLQTS